MSGRKIIEGLEAAVKHARGEESGRRTYSFRIAPERKAELCLIGDATTQLANAGADQDARPRPGMTLEELARTAHWLARRALVFVVRPEHEAAVREADHRITDDS